MAKRVFDILGAAMGLMLLLPMLALIALWVPVDSPGPVLFRQQRVGQYGRLFCIYKFRTMTVNADMGGSLLTVGADARITRSGRFLRKYKLDELPQLLNVLRGEMSLVGPRPEVPKYVAHYPEDVRKVVLSLKPGVTDLASIEYRDESRILGASENPEKDYIEQVLPAKLAYYCDYAKRRSLWLDIAILFKTVQTIYLN